jgi:hypothetical protein
MRKTKTCKFYLKSRKYAGWNEREIHAKEDEDYFNESDDDEEGTSQKHVPNTFGSKNESNLKEKSDQLTPNSTPNLSFLKLDSVNASRSNSEEKSDDKLLNKKHGLEKIALYEENYLNANENVDLVVVGSGSNDIINGREKEKRG